MSEQKQRTFKDLGDSLSYRHDARFIVKKAKEDGLDQDATEKRLTQEFNKNANISAGYNAYIGLGGAFFTAALFTVVPAPGVIGLAVLTTILFSAVKGTLGTFRLMEQAYDEKFGNNESRYKRITNHRAEKNAKKALKTYF